ncbi:MAG: hypothetical protein KME15_16715 [Drouetiella hepatica Uher 2000/2452]|jgi:hypothetical protein|uniref:Uncharacterized protein n=1 Tax=Drouetiella hepatica Uher 2000/2452 TaxID=904376 RepID=A0A951QFA2_9CYAN|nr:hypothetical protein [Drouetiella hepatica Uher 2000/2452]
MTAQDFLTWILIAILIFSVLNFGMLFVIDLSDRSRLPSQTAKLPTPVASPAPIAVLPAPILPAILVEQADHNLDSQIAQLAQLNQIVSNSRSTAFPLHPTGKEQQD